MRPDETVVIDSRFNGPPAAGNGGYVGGVLARRFDGPAEVTFRAPVPLDTPLTLVGAADGSLHLKDRQRVVCEARAATVGLDPPKPPFDWDLAARLRERGGSDGTSAFNACFVCGRGRARGDGLQVWGERAADGLSLSPYTPHQAHSDADGLIRFEFLWAALDCPGAWAAQPADDTRAAVTGRMTAEVLRRPRHDEPCLVVGWRIGAEGRKLHAGTALYTRDGTLCAVARQVWIVVREEIAVTG